MNGNSGVLLTLSEEPLILSFKNTKINRRVAVGLVLAPVLSSCASEVTKVDSDSQFIKDVLFTLNQPDIDLLNIKLAVDNMISPGDSNSIKLQVKYMADGIRANFTEKSTDRQKLEALKTYLYTPGKWNSNEPFAYDMQDPLGKEISSKLLSTYLHAKKGNCVSMPLLFLFVGQEIGLNISLARAPEHLFVKFTDEGKRTYNIETTSGGGFTRNEWIAKQLPMTQASVDSGLHMRSLTKKESAIVIIETLLEYYWEQKKYQQVISLSNALLPYYPNNAYLMLHLSASYASLAKIRQANQQKSGQTIIGSRIIGNMFESASMEWQQKARRIGWQELPS